MKKPKALIVTDVSAAEYAKRGGGVYLDRLAALMTSGVVERGKLYDIQIQHDDWCALLDGRGPCNCDPDIKLRGEK